ncbi:hypothetical protein SAMN06272721_103199 [Arthrobacter sp. P2b]|nr:hypothetical protein SAMN06272721_103199 [Arthrobacter sp. P2b]
MDRQIFYSYAALANSRLPVLDVAAPCLGKLVLFDPVSAKWAMVGDRHLARDSRDTIDHASLVLCGAQTRATGKQRWTLVLAKLQQRRQINQAIRHLTGGFARVLVKSSGQLRDQAVVNPRDSCDHAKRGRTFDAHRQRYGDNGAHRAAFLRAPGGARVVYRALFSGLLDTASTPIATDPYNLQVLADKQERSMKYPPTSQVTSSRDQDKLTARAFAGAWLVVGQLTSPTSCTTASGGLRIPAAGSEHPRRCLRVSCAAERRIETVLWSADFVDEFRTKIVLELLQPADGTKVWQADFDTATTKGSPGCWHSRGRSGRRARSPDGIRDPRCARHAGLRTVSARGLLRAERPLDLHDEKKNIQGNGLHYLLRVRAARELPRGATKS